MNDILTPALATRRILETPGPSQCVKTKSSPKQTSYEHGGNGSLYPMPSPQDQDDSLAAALSKEISALHDAHSCSICHGLLSAPVSLLCSHVFCSECARRHLRNKSTCPHPICRKPATYRQLTPLRAYDVALEPLRRSAEKVEPFKLNAESRLIFLSRKTSTRAQLFERLRAHNLPTHGGADALDNRYNDFVVRWNANLDAGVPKPKKAIVAAVMAAEVPKRPRISSSFFKNIVSQESTGDDEIPTPGDDHATLVKKTAARMKKEKKRKLAANVQNSEKRICLDTMGLSQKTELECQATVINDPTKSLDNISRPSANRTSSKPADVREESNGMRDVSRDGVSSQFDNNSPLVTGRIEPAGLAVHNNVCSVDVISEGVNRDFGSSLGRADQSIRTESHNANVLLPQAPFWSQTTPEKRTVPADECHANSSLTHDARIIRSSTPTKVPSSTQVVQEAPVASSTQKLEQTTESGPGSSNASSATAKRPRARSPPRTPSIDERNMSKIPPENVERSAVHGHSQPEMDSRDHTPRDVFWDSGNPSSTDVTPTKAQLQRAERNRLAALERRRKFYEVHELSQMRQPDL